VRDLAFSGSGWAVTQPASQLSLKRVSKRTGFLGCPPPAFVPAGDDRAARIAKDKENGVGERIDRSFSHVPLKR
jgi:hypothetical protein